MKITSGPLKAFIYITSIVLLISGGLAIYLLLGDHPYVLWFIIGYVIISSFFLSMKVYLYRAITGAMNKRRTSDG